MDKRYRQSKHYGLGKSVSNRRFKLARLFGVVFLVGLLLFLVSRQFAIKKVSVITTGLSCASSDQIARFVSAQGRSLVLFDLARVQKAILTKFNCVSQVDVVRVWPSALEIKVQGRLPVALIVSDSGGLQIQLKQIESTASSHAALLNFSTDNPASQPLMVDKLGYVFGNASEGAKLPLVRFETQSWNIGESVSLSLLNGVLSINQELLKLGYLVTLLRINAVNDLIVITDPGLKLVFSLNKDLNIQLASLQLILQKAKIESKPIDSIDLRFNKPVVVYK